MSEFKTEEIVKEEGLATGHERVEAFLEKVARYESLVREASQVEAQDSPEVGAREAMQEEELLMRGAEEESPEKGQPKAPIGEGAVKGEKRFLKWMLVEGKITKELKNFVRLVDCPFLRFKEETSQAYYLGLMIEELKSISELVLEKSELGGSRPKIKKGQEFLRRHMSTLDTKMSLNKRKSLQVVRRTYQAEPPNFYDDLIECDLVLTFPNELVGDGRKWMKKKLVSLKYAMAEYAGILDRKSEAGVLSKRSLKADKMLFFNVLLFFQFVLCKFREGVKPCLWEFFEHLFDLKLGILEESSSIRQARERHNVTWRGVTSKTLLEAVQDNQGLSLFFPLFILSEKKEIPRALLAHIIRRFMMMKYNQVGIFTREFLSQKKDKVFVLLKATRAALDFAASSRVYFKEMEIGMVDLFSLEPVDSSLRPLSGKRYRTNSAGALNAHRKSIFQMENKDQAWEWSEEHLRQTFPKIDKLTEEEMTNFIVVRLSQVNSCLLKIKKTIKAEEKVDLIFKMKHEEFSKDQKMEKKHSKVFCLYLQHLYKYLERVSDMLHDPDSKEFTTAYLNLLLHLVYMKSKGDANQIYREKHRGRRQKARLNTVWDQLDIKPMAPYADYTSKIPKESWRSYQINETGLRSIFTPADRIRLAEMLLTDTTNLQRASLDKFLFAFYPIHDSYILNGIAKRKRFESLGKGQVKKLPRALLDLLFDLSDEADDSDFIKQSIQEASTFGVTTMFHLPMDLFRNYFGEKITIYFLFLTTYAKTTMIPAFLGTFFFFLQYFFWLRTFSCRRKWSTCFAGQ
jgi:hypothetical protein